MIARMTAVASAIRLLVVDDSALVREGLRAVISTHGHAFKIEWSGEATSVAEAVNAARRLKPDVVLMDIRLPDGSGIDACREVRRISPTTRVLMLSSMANDDLIHRAVMAGAQGYLMKEVDPMGLIRAICDAAAGKSVLTPEVTDRVLRLLRDGGTRSGGANLAQLSAQERKVLECVAEGLTNKQTGEKLNLSENTVKNYLVTVFEKLQVKRRSQAAALFVQNTHNRE